MDNKATSPKRSISRRYGASLTVGLIGLALSLTAFFSVREWETKLQELDFDRLAEARCELFDREVIGSISKLTALKQFFDGSQFVDRREFTTFINPLHEISTHKLAFFWAPQVLEANRRSFEKAALAEGISDFSIHCDSPVDGIAAVTQRERYYPVLYYCHESNWAMGLDLLREPHLRKAIKQAVDTDQPVVTGSILFPGKQQDWSGVAVLQAVYHKGLPTTTVEERRCAIEGVVVCAMQLGEILEDVIQTLTPVGIDIQVADLSTPEGKQILYQYSARLQSGDTGDTLNETSDASGLIYATTFDVAGHTWELRCTPSTGYLAAHPLRTHWIVLFGGLILTTLLAIQLYLMRNRTAIVEAIVDERTAQLRETTDYLQNLFDYANAPIIVWDPEFKITRFNHAFENMTQRSADEVLGKPLSILFPEESLEQAMTHIDSTLSGERWEAVEIPIQRADGEVRIVLWNSAGIHSDNGDSIIATIAQGQDITERKRAEEALRESEQKVSAAFNQTFQFMGLMELDGTLLEANHTALEFAGIEEKDVLGKPFWETVWWTHSAELQNELRDAVKKAANGQFMRFETTHRAHDGTLHNVDFSLKPVKNENGTVRYLVAEGHNITERKQAEEALRESEERVRALSDAAFEAIFFSERGICTDQNKTAEKMFGYTSSEAIGRPFTDWIVPADREMVRNNMLCSRKEPYEATALRKDGATFPALIQARMIDYRGRQVRVTSLRDISARKQALKGLRESEERYRRITDAITDYIYTVRVEDGQPAETIHGHACEAVTGYSTEEFRIDPYLWIQMIPQEDRDPVRDQMSRILSGDDPEPIEHHLMRKDGCVRWVTSVLVANRDGRGNLLSYDGLIRDITERKQAEEALRESEERFRTIFETAEDSIFIKDRNLRYTMVNPAMGKLFGVPVSQIIGKTDSELFGEEAGAYVREVDTRVLNGEILREEHTKPVNKVPFTFNVVKVPMRDNEGNILGLCGIARDVTERKRTEETLKQSAKNYRDLFNNATDAIYIQDKEGRFLDVNQGAVDMYGYPKECFIGKTPEFLSAPGKNDLKKIIGFVEDAFNGKPRQYDFWGIRKSGEVFPKIVRSQRGFYQGRKVIITFALDITERKRAESVLQMERDKLTAIFESMEDGVYIVNKDHDIEYVNPVLKKEFGSPEGKKCHKYFHGSDEPCTFCRNEEVLAGKTVHWEWTSPKNGKTYDLIDTPFKNADGSISKLEMFRDITEILRLRELETRAQRLESAGSIAGQVAHDFNNLLGPLMAYPELIREELPEDHKVLTFLSSIETAAEQMADINQDLLTMGRRGHYNMKPMNMNEVVLQAVKELQPPPETLVCETNLDEDLMNILGGPSQVYRAVANILHNARDAMQDIGTITINTENYYADDVTIAYNRVPRGEYVKLTISDTGSGIPDDIVEKIFEPFFTSKATDKKRGSGLGMSVVDAVIKDHKGYIDLSTKVGEGTSFYLYFPVTRETIEAQETDQIAGGCETVLVVDDDDIQRDIVRSLLQKLGYEVSVVESGEKAIKFLRNNPQDLLILDMIMPSGMDGADTYTKVVEIYPQQKAIVVSGYSETESVQKVQSLGAGAFIKKPVTLHKIAGAVRKELDREVGVAV